MCQRVLEVHGGCWISCEYASIAFTSDIKLTRTIFKTVGENFPPMTDIRPNEIGVWMKTRRLWIDIPIANIDSYTIAWWSWWVALQPEERKQHVVGNDANPLTMPTIDMDWKKLRKTGKNGLSLVMVTLIWWGKMSSCSEEWKMAVMDVCGSIGCLGDSGAVVPLNIPLGSSNTPSLAARRPSRERKCVRPRDEDFEERPKKKGRSRR